MIIATIGNVTMRLASINDAEALMQISARSAVIDDAWDENSARYYYPDLRDQTINISIVNDALMVTEEVHQSRVKARAEKRAQAAAEGGAA